MGCDDFNKQCLQISRQKIIDIRHFYLGIGIPKYLINKTHLSFIKTLSRVIPSSKETGMKKKY